MRSGRPRTEAEPLGFGGEGFDVAGKRVVAFVAVQVDHQPASCGDFAQGLHRRRAFRHRAFEMRNAADDVDAEIERALEIPRRGRRAEIAVLRKGDQLQVEIGLYPLLHLEEGLDREQAIVADVDVAAHGEKTLRHGEIAVAQRALGDGFLRQSRLEFAPERDPFQQGPGDVQPGQAERQRRVHMEVAVDERRRQKIAARIDGLLRLRADLRLDRGDASGGDRDVLPLASVRQRRVADDQVEIHRVSSRCVLNPRERRFGRPRHRSGSETGST